jgi:DNA-binding transcriptional regulator YiaG
MKATDLKKIRAKLGLSQTALAERLGVTRNTVTRWEMGLHPIPLMAIKLLRTLATLVIAVLVGGV